MRRLRKLKQLGMLEERPAQRHRGLLVYYRLAPWLTTQSGFLLFHVISKPLLYPPRPAQRPVRGSAVLLNRCVVTVRRPFPARAAAPTAHGHVLRVRVVVVLLPAGGGRDKRTQL